MMQYAGTPQPQSAGTGRHPYANHGRTVSHQSQFSGLPEM